MGQKFRTIGGDIVVLEYRDVSFQHEGCCLFYGKFIHSVKSYIRGAWNIRGEVASIDGMVIECNPSNICNLDDFSAEGLEIESL